MTRPVNRWTLVLAAGIVPVAISPTALAAAGKVLAVNGSVGVTGVQARELKAGDEVEVGDVVVTQDGSSAQLLMADGSRLEVRAGSQVRIDSVVLPSSVEHPEAKESQRTVGQTVATLLNGSVSGRSATFAASAGSVRELHTPYGKLAVTGASYTAELCESNCADYADQKGLRVGVDRGVVAFTGNDVPGSDGSATWELQGPHTGFFPATEFPVAGEGAQSASTVATASLKPSPDSPVTLNLLRPGAPDRSIEAQSLLGRPVDLINSDLPYDSRVTSAIFVPLSASQRYVLSGTELSDMQSFNTAGNLMQFNAPFGGANGSTATYLSGTANLLDSGRNGLSGIRWGRWAGGTATISTVSGSEQLDLGGASLHWISGPMFEAAPQIPTAGQSFFVLGGGTSPTDDAGHAGVLNAATLSANFTTQQVSAAVSLNVNGYNWFANGSGSLVSGTPRFNGAFTTVLIDGRIAGSGEYSGFFSAGALSPDQLNGAGISYWLTDNSGQLGTVYGVVAYVPGGPTDLGAPPVLRDVAYAVGKLNASQIAGGVAANRPDQLSLTSAGLTRFNAPVLASPLGVLSIGLSTLVDTGQNAATGIRWGRWEGGAIDVTNASQVTQANDISTQSLHWIVGNEYGTAPVLPQSGTATYTLVGGTTPTDTLSHTGTLGSASFNANFTTRLITSDLALNINGVDWYARGNATYNIGNNEFEGTYDDVRAQNLVRGQGTLFGFFTQPRVGTATSAGAGMSYNITDNSRQLGVISGVLAFVEGGAGATVTPPAPQSRDLAFVAPEIAAAGPQAVRSAPTDYSLDSNFRLTSLTGTTNSGTIDSARYGIGSARVMSSGVSPLVMLRWGRWSDGVANVTNLVNGTSHPVDLSLQSLHWIEGADGSPPVMPTTGTASYALIGATLPTDRAGNSGILNNASLTANFTAQQISASFDATVNNVNVMATGTGNIGAAAGLQSHQFNGTINSGSFSNSAATPQGSFSGFFTAPGGSQPGIPGGAGVTYSISDGLGHTVDGAAAFRSP